MSRDIESGYSIFRLSLLVISLHFAVPFSIAQDRTLELISVSSDEAPSNDYSDNSSISSNGRFVAFRSYASNLVDGDTNGRGDIYSCA